MTILELRKQIEDKVNPILDWTPAEKLTAYKALHNSGCRMDGIDYRIDHLLMTESKGETIKRC